MMNTVITQINSTRKDARKDASVRRISPADPTEKVSDTMLAILTVTDQMIVLISKGANMMNTATITSTPKPERRICKLPLSVEYASAIEEPMIGIKELRVYFVAFPAKVSPAEAKAPLSPNTPTKMLIAKAIV